MKQNKKKIVGWYVIRFYFIESIAALHFPIGVLILDNVFVCYQWQVMLLLDDQHSLKIKKNYNYV